MVDPAAKKVLSAKRYADLLLASARLDGDARRRSPCPTAPSTPPTTPACTTPCRPGSTWTCASSRRPPTRRTRWRCTRGCPTRTRPLFDWAGPPGTWVDLADSHWLTTASLATIAGEHPDGQWDVRRFRPTGLIETTGRTDSATRRRAGPPSTLGEAQVEVLMPTMRCSMPSRAQPGLDRDKAIGTTIRDANSNNLGVYASVTRSGTVRVGDSVHAT